MLDSFIGKHIRCCNRNLLLANAAIVLAVVGTGWFNWRYLYNFSMGPSRIDSQSLITTANSGTVLRYFVTIKGDKFTNVGQEITQSVDKYSRPTYKVSASYIALSVENRLLIIKAQTEYNDTAFTGALTEDSQLISEVETKNPELKGVFLPVVLDTTDFRSRGYWGLAIGTPFLLLGLWNLYKFKKRQENPEEHPIAKSLSKFGSPQVIAGNIDSEIQMSDNSAVGSVVITRSWLLKPTTFGLDILNLEDIVWVYKKVTKHYINMIPTGKTIAALIRNRQGQSLEIQGNDSDIDLILERIFNQVPWILLGFSKELENLWDYDDRSGIIAMVDERRYAR